MLFETWRQYAEHQSLGSKNEPGKAAEPAISLSIGKTRQEVISVLYSPRQTVMKMSRLLGGIATTGIVPRRILAAARSTDF
jgi:hypothetical protein